MYRPLFRAAKYSLDIEHLLVWGGWSNSWWFLWSGMSQSGELHICQHPQIVSTGLQFFPPKKKRYNDLLMPSKRLSNHGKLKGKVIRDIAKTKILLLCILNAWTIFCLVRKRLNKLTVVISLGLSKPMSVFVQRPELAQLFSIEWWLDHDKTFDSLGPFIPSKLTQYNSCYERHNKQCWCPGQRCWSLCASISVLWCSACPSLLTLLTIVRESDNLYLFLQQLCKVRNSVYPHVTDGTLNNSK